MVRTLRRGDSGRDVSAVQGALNLHRPGQEPLDTRGVFGPLTDAAVRQFQRENGLDDDGAVGRFTRVKLFPLATVTIRMVGTRLRLPSFGRPPAPRAPNLFPDRLSFGGDPPSPGPAPSLPTLGPISLYQPVSYPRLLLPIATPPLAPAAFPGLTLPVHHFEVAPGGSTFLLPRGRGVDTSFSLSVSGIVMIGDEKLTHNEFSSGLLFGTPGVNSGGDWTVGWFAQITHVHQLNRAGNFSWQPNAQIVRGFGASPFLTLTASPANVQFDANDTFSLSLGGPNASMTFDPNGGTLSIGLFSFGVVGKFN